MKGVREAGMYETALEILNGFWGVLGEMSPYLLLGFLVAGVLSVLISAETVERHLGGRGLGSVAKAAAFGVPLPLCSCGVIPVAASLRRHGASRGATVAFLLSTPQTGVDSIFVTLSLLGGTFAIFRPVAAMVSGLLGGALVEGLTRPNGTEAEKPAPCTDACCAPGGGGRLRRVLRYAFGDLPQDIGPSLLGGLLIAALITAVLPSDFLAPVLGGGLLAMVLMMLVGIPVYVCATASVPVAAALIAKGVSPGAALVFLMTGPATNAATIATIWRVMGRRTALLYLATVAVTALGSGLVLDYLFRWQGAAAVGTMGWMLPGTVKNVCAVLLLGVLAVAVVRSRLTRHAHAPGDGHAAAEAPPEQAMPTVVLRITGMTCTHCRDSVLRALVECPGTVSADVDLAGGRASVTGSAEPAELRKAVEQLGFGVTEAESLPAGPPTA
ncbi:MAG TPA: SO_0444 family Cu/Zn efflux transporter [Phycisphaerae bacterium]|nr:SO_0444 family Cu/Zn efflux transporter [Phycisphaerae bacterium]